MAGWVGAHWGVLAAGEPEMKPQVGESPFGNPVTSWSPHCGQIVGSAIGDTKFKEAVSHMQATLGAYSVSDLGKR